MKKARFNLLIGVVFAFALCMMASCQKEKTTGQIQGLVTNYNTNEPIQGVNISLSPTGASAVTGSDGRYEFANLAPGNYTVQGMKQGFESNTKNITITAGNVSSGDMQLRPAATGFRLNVEYLDFGSAFSNLTFKIINASANTPMSWEISESLNWLTDKRPPSPWTSTARSSPKASRPTSSCAAPTKASCCPSTSPFRAATARNSN